MNIVLNMWFFYVIALIPALIGLILYFFTKKINISEWIGATVVAFVISGIMHASAYVGMTSDTEIWSGQTVCATKYPFWIEEYQEAIYVSRLEPVTHYSNGKMSVRLESVRRFSHYETRHRDHHQYFQKDVSFGACSITYNISEQEYNDIVAKFGNSVETRFANKSGFDGGDHNIYVAHNKTKYIFPSTTVKSFVNKIRASPSTFSFATVPVNAGVYEYPQCQNPWVSDRLLGDARNKINTFAFDQLNSELGPIKEVNIIICGFNSADANLGKLQEAKWLGGKKNDIVICYGYAPLEGNIPNICWTYCFSWTKNDQLKRNLEEIFKNNPIDTSILPLVKAEVMKNFQRRQWSEFDILTVKPRPIHLYILLSIMVGVQLCIWLVSYFNDFDKGANL